MNIILLRTLFLACFIPAQWWNIISHYCMEKI